MRAGWRVWRLRLTALVLLLVALLAAYWFWFRDSSLVAVTRVEVRGATVNRNAIQKSLDRVGRQMTTLNVDQGKLIEALGAFPTVAAITTSTDLPHTLEVRIRERPPVAVSTVEGEVTGISADGYALIGLDVSGFELPTITATLASGGLVDDRGIAQASVIGATPEPLEPGLISAAWEETYGGVVVDLSGAPQLRFGDGDDGRAKWAAASALLADPGLGSPTYIDVSAPGRPVTG